MKIGILTQRLAHNYGCFLQNFALQRVLYNLGHEPITLTYSTDSISNIIDTYLSFIYRSLRRDDIRHFIETKGNLRRLESNFHRFKNDFINMSYVGRRQINGTKVSKLNLDAIIVGSDQVWRPAYNNGRKGALLYNMFLDFVMQDIKKISYAASFGVDNWEFSDKQTKIIRELINDFDAVSVREKSGVKLCKDYLDINAVHVLDPTMLLNSHEYEELGLSNKPNKKIVAYILSPTSNKMEYISRLSHKKGFETMFIGCPDNNHIYPPVEQWIDSIKNSEFVITDSFHGTVFSILFNKDFINLGNKGRGQSRIDSLCSMFEISGRCLNETNLNNVFMEFPIIEWDKVNRLLEFQRDKSINFLKTLL